MLGKSGAGKIAQERRKTPGRIGSGEVVKVVRKQTPHGMRETRSVEYFPLAMSVWGRRVMWLRSEYDMTYKDIAVAVQMDMWAIRKMVTEPTYEPVHSRGQRFIRYYNARRRDSTTRRISAVLQDTPIRVAERQ